MGKCKRRDSEEKEGGREKERRRGTERDASPGMPFRVSRQVAISSKRRPRPSESASQPASQSQTKSHGFTYYDLHPCPLPLLRFLLSSRLSPPRPPTLPPLPPPFSCLAPARATSFVSFSRFILSRNVHFWYRLEKCHFTDVSVLSSFPFPRRAIRTI